MLKFIGIVAELFHELIADSSYHVDKICFIVERSKKLTTKTIGS